METPEMPTARPARSNTKAELLDRSRELFARHGYEGVSMRDIAGAIGVRQSAIYNHFGSKQELLTELMVSHMERVLSAMQSAVDPMPDAAKKLAAFARFHVMYHIDHPEDVFLAYMELRSLDKNGRDTIYPLRHAYEATLRQILEDGKAQGVFRIGNPAVAARAMLAMLTGVTVWFREDGSLDRGTVADTYVQAALQSVGLPSP